MNLTAPASKNAPTNGPDIEQCYAGIIRKSGSVAVKYACSLGLIRKDYNLDKWTGICMEIQVNHNWYI